MNLHIHENPNASCCLIWMHGLGANAQDMIGLAQAFPSDPPLKHVFLDAPVRQVTINNYAPMRAWYDIFGVKLTDRQDKHGIHQSETLILEALQSQIDAGFKPNHIFLAGFSQGGAMALFTGLRLKEPLAGIISLSGYLPLADELEPVISTDTPVFMAAGLYDSIVQPQWTKQSATWLQSKAFNHIEYHEYPMEHSVCPEEIRDLNQWLKRICT